jgi:hypothetical protein
MTFAHLTLTNKKLHKNKICPVFQNSLTVSASIRILLSTRRIIFGADKKNVGVWSIPKDNDSNSSRFKGKTKLFYGEKNALNLIYASGIIFIRHD